MNKAAELISDISRITPKPTPAQGSRSFCLLPNIPGVKFSAILPVHLAQTERSIRIFGLIHHGENGSERKAPAAQREEELSWIASSDHVLGPVGGTASRGGTRRGEKWGAGTRGASRRVQEAESKGGGSRRRRALADRKDRITSLIRGIANGPAPKLREQNAGSQGLGCGETFVKVTNVQPSDE